MSKNRVIVEAVLAGQSHAAVARQYRISTVWVGKLVARWRTGGWDAVEKQSTRPKSNPNATGDDVIARIITLRLELTAAGLDAGPHTIATHLERHRLTVPSVATIWRILTRAGLVTPSPASAPRAASFSESGVHNGNHLRYSNLNGELAGSVGVMDPRIDELDIKLLDLLQADARMPYVQLASRLGVSDTTVRSRIDRLVSQLGVKFGVDVDPADLGLLYLYMAARVQGPSLARAIERVSQLPEIVFLARTTGGYDLLAEVVCRGRVDLIRVLDELRAIPGLVHIEMLHVLTVEKEDWRISRFASASASASTEP